MNGDDSTDLEPGLANFPNEFFLPLRDLHEDAVRLVFHLKDAFTKSLDLRYGFYEGIDRLGSVRIDGDGLWSSIVLTDCPNHTPGYVDASRDVFEDYRGASELTARGLGGSIDPSRALLPR